MNKRLIILFVICLFGLSQTVFADNDSDATQKVKALYESAPPEKVLKFTLAMLNSLNLMNIAWPKGGASNENADANTILTQTMRELLDSNKYLDRAEFFISPYQKDSNEIIQLAASALSTGTRLARIANTSYLDFLKKLETLVGKPNASGEVRMATAQFQSDRKEAYISAITGASSVLMLFWESPETPNPSGKIRWRLSDEQRKTVLDNIERYFGSELKKLEIDRKNKTNSYGVIPVMMAKFKSDLSTETYEQAREKERLE